MGGSEAVVLKGASTRTLTLVVQDSGAGPYTWISVSDPSFQKQGRRKGIIIYMQSTL